MKKIKVGIWGLGRAGYGMHLPETQQFPELFEVVAACDIARERLGNFAQKAPGARLYSDGDAFLADPGVELFAVAVRSPQHVDYDIRALATGKYVLAEKPFAISVAGLRKLLAAEKKHPGKLIMRHNRRFEPAFNHIREIIGSGILGEVFEIKLCRHGWSFRDDWQTLVSCGGGQLNNWGPHLIDHALLLLGAPVESVWSDMKTVAAVGDAEDHFKAVFRGANGRVVDVEVSGGIALPSPVYAVYGTRGSLVCDDEKTIRIKSLAKNFKLPPRMSAKDGTPDFTFNFCPSHPPQWVEESIPVAPANGVTMNDNYRFIYDTIRKGKKYPITLAEASEVVKWTETIKKQNKAAVKKRTAQPV